MLTSGDKRIVMTLDAGGTNFVFSAIRANREIVTPVILPSNGNDLDSCLNTIVTGFLEIKRNLPCPPVAISFAFPGPADYPNGIIGDLANIPAFHGGIALGPMLREIFDIPVYINNDGDLFAYGEAMGGFLPWINEQLEKAGSPKRYQNLFGITLGTGFGAGIVRNGELFTGDNSNAAEIWLMRHKTIGRCFAEEGVSIRAIQRVYHESAQVKPSSDLAPKDIYEVATGKKDGDKQAALKAFSEMAEVTGDALANAITLIDGLIVVGGGLAGAYPILIDILLKEINGSIETVDGKKTARLVQKVFNAEDELQLKEFLAGSKKEIKVPRSGKTLLYDPLKRTAIGLSRLGTSQAVSLGAYAFALNETDK
jgi:glucokinase